MHFVLRLVLLWLTLSRRFCGVGDAAEWEVSRVPGVGERETKNEQECPSSLFKHEAVKVIGIQPTLSGCPCAHGKDCV